MNHVYSLGRLRKEVRQAGVEMILRHGGKGRDMGKQGTQPECRVMGLQRAWAWELLRKMNLKDRFQEGQPGQE